MTQIMGAFTKGIVCTCMILTSLTIINAQESDTVQAAGDSTQAESDIRMSGAMTSHDQIFTPGNALKLTVYPDTAGFPNGVYIIDDNGYVDFPIIGYKKVTDKTISRLESLLKDAYVEYLPQPNIQVRPLIRASVIGGFHVPGLYWIDSRESMWSLIQRAGGTIREDGIEKVKWRRNNETIVKNCVSYIESGKSLRSIGFESGDQVTVTPRPKQRFWDVFRGDVLPMLTVTLSAMASAASVYMAYETFKDRR